jgi:GTP-binding protein
VLVTDGSLRDLQSFRRRAHFKGARGGHGEGGERHGASPAVLEVPVPPGTVVEEVDGDLRFDLTRPGQRAVVARGGAGGRGNKRFTKSTRQAPRFAEKGLPGEERWLELRLKLLADVGLVGLPNAGKSSLLARVTRAAPKVANYPFTTLEPVLGMLEGAERQLVLADIPGLIEGASGGAGLGHEFLAHVERTGLLVHVLDLAPLDASDPVANHTTVEEELAGYGHGLAELPRMLALSKADLVPPEDAARAAAEWRERLPDALAVVVTSAATGEGLEELARELLRHVPEHSVEPPAAEDDIAEHKVYRPADDAGYNVERGPGGVLRVVGPAVERLLARHDIENEEALRYVEDRLRKMGVIRALEQAGFEPGDDVELAGTVFELDPGSPFR